MNGATPSGSWEELFVAPLHWMFVFFGWFSLAVFGVALQILAVSKNLRISYDRRLGKPVKGHAILERTLLVGTRSADHIRASGHSGCIAMEVHFSIRNRPDTWLHPNASQTSDSSCTAGAVHTWPLATDIALQPNVRFRGIVLQKSPTSCR